MREPRNTKPFVISFSLFGSRAKYIEGAIQNAIIAPHVYPEWTVRFYHDKEIGSETIRTLQSLGAETIFMDGHFASPTFWRFLANDDPCVERWISRDCDSRLNYRERRAVDEWVHSKAHCHAIKDHPNHKGFPLLAGTFGLTKDAVPNMEALMQEWNKFDHPTDDQYFLQEKVWPLVYLSTCVHDQFGNHPLPTPYEDYRYVGEPFEEGSVLSTNKEYRQQLIDACCKSERQFHHVVSVYKATDPEETRRNAVAEHTWHNLTEKHRNFRTWFFEDGMAKRSSKDLGDNKTIPYLKDVIQYGVLHAKSPSDIIVFTNADNCLSLDTIRIVSAAMKAVPACVSQRYNYQRIEKWDWKPTAKGEGGQFLPGFDLFAFTVEWWEKHKSKVADMLIGYEAWDCMLECLIRWEGGVILSEPVVYHEWHEQNWHKNRLTAAGQQYNLRTFFQWAMEMGKLEEVKTTHSYSFEAIKKMIFGK